LLTYKIFITEHCFDKLQNQFLNIPQNSGYDYYVMSFLDWNGVCEHGSGIRCAWLADDMGRKLSDDRRKIIKEWADRE